MNLIYLFPILLWNFIHIYLYKKIDRKFIIPYFNLNIETRLNWTDIIAFFSIFTLTSSLFKSCLSLLLYHLIQYPLYIINTDQFIIINQYKISYEYFLGFLSLICFLCDFKSFIIVLFNFLIISYSPTYLPSIQSKYNSIIEEEIKND